MQSEKANEDVLELSTEMDIKNPLIKWYVHGSHRLVQRERGASMIQTTSLVHHMFIERRRDLVRLAVIHRPHCPDHGTEANELHCRRKMYHLVRALLVSDGCVARREIRKFRIHQITADDPLDGKVSVVQSERGLKGLFRIWETMACEVDPFVLAKLFNDPRSARFLSI